MKIEQIKGGNVELKILSVVNSSSSGEVEFSRVVFATSRLCCCFFLTIEPQVVSKNCFISKTFQA